MRFARSCKGFAALACLTWAMAVMGAKAAPTAFTVQLSGTEEVPAVKSSGSGVANLTYDPASRITYAGLSSPVTMAHFHGPAAEGKNAGPVISIGKPVGATKGPMKGKATLTPTQAKGFVADEWYIKCIPRTGLGRHWSLPGVGANRPSNRTGLLPAWLDCQRSAPLL